MSVIDKSKDEKFIFRHYNECFNELRELIGHQ